MNIKTEEIDTGIKLAATIPMFEEKELEIFDNNIHNIIEEYSKLHLEKKEQILTQRIIIKQEEEIKKYKEVLDKIKEKVKENIDDEFYINLTNKEKALHEINDLLEKIE